MGEVESLAAEVNAGKDVVKGQAPSAFINPTTFVALMPLCDAMRLTQDMPKYFGISGGEDDEAAIESLAGYRRVSRFRSQEGGDALGFAWVAFFTRAGLLVTGILTTFTFIFTILCQLETQRC